MSTHILKKGYTALAWPTSAMVAFSDKRPEERLLYLDPPANDILERDISKAAAKIISFDYHSEEETITIETFETENGRILESVLADNKPVKYYLYGIGLCDYSSNSNDSGMHVKIREDGDSTIFAGFVKVQ